MSEISCKRCGRSRPAMAQPPMAGELGIAAQGGTCADCWKVWMDEQVRLINHLGLKPWQAADREVLAQKLREFLGL
ncbi:MAG: Fe(2+)-trafficking protein [Chloroflexi bacterium]|nr:Fe(2+)-trafficking protein [Chloroflexota bacterium]